MPGRVSPELRATLAVLSEGTGISLSAVVQVEADLQRLTNTDLTGIKLYEAIINAARKLGDSREAVAVRNALAIDVPAGRSLTARRRALAKTDEWACDVRTVKRWELPGFHELCLWVLLLRQEDS